MASDVNNALFLKNNDFNFFLKIFNGFFFWKLLTGINFRDIYHISGTYNIFQGHITYLKNWRQILNVDNIFILSFAILKPISNDLVNQHAPITGQSPVIFLNFKLKYFGNRCQITKLLCSNLYSLFRDFKNLIFYILF